jgi:hypothetical protein
MVKSKTRSSRSFSDVLRRDHGHMAAIRSGRVEPTRDQDHGCVTHRRTVPRTECGRASEDAAPVCPCGVRSAAVQGAGGAPVPPRSSGCGIPNSRNIGI